MTIDREQQARAREVLASHYEERGRPLSASGVRLGHHSLEEDWAIGLMCTFADEARLAERERATAEIDALSEATLSLLKAAEHAHGWIKAVRKNARHSDVEAITYPREDRGGLVPMRKLLDAIRTARATAIRTPNEGKGRL